MDSYTIKICALTQSPEKFLCLNQECQRNDKKQIQCYECLNKLHIGKNRTIRHLDDIIELDKFMKKIQEKNNKKEQFINQLILMCNDFQKDKIQQIELTQKQDVATLAREKIEAEVSQFTITLGQEVLKLKSYLFYSQSKHEQLMKCFYENEQIYIENTKFQYKQLVEKIQAFVFSLDYDIKSQISKLEDKIKCFQNTAGKIKGTPNSSLIILLFILPSVLSYFINQQFFDPQVARLQFQINQQYNQINQQHSGLDTQIKELKNQFEMIADLNQTFEGMKKIVSKAQKEIDQTAENIEKLKLRFDAFKSNQYNQLGDLKKQINILSENQQQFKLENWKIIQEKIMNLSDSFVNFLKRYDNDMLIYSKKLIDSHIATEPQENQKQTIEKTQNSISQKQRLMIENKDLIGKIHQNLTLTRFANFTLLYDHFFNQYLSLSRIDNIYKKAIQNNSDSLICIGGLSISNLEEFMLVACDFASEIFQPSSDITKARKSINGDVYWYMVDYFSFGFSPKEKVFLTLCDNEELDDELRFSYWFGQQGRNGGRRLGKLTQLENSLQHKMQIYMLS